jgi:bifunctional non-homologous end joining protein LigD
MPLEDYRRKRDFTRSPEPTGTARRARSRKGARALYFCVHKHLASHLHYDFRIEHGGVLLSWAVPKGPSLDPSVKRFARFVEDHPIDYGSFEGVIPEGYGAGIVMLWDYGTWSPDVDDVDAALARGELKFSLDGFKLKGSWVLVRTRGFTRGRGKDDDRNWLLIKHRDEWSGDLDIAEFAPRSVKSDQDFAEILADDDPDIWRSNRPVEGGETGAMLRKIIEQAAAIKAGRRDPEKKKAAKKARKKSAKKTTTRKKPTARSRTPR